MVRPADADLIEELRGKPLVKLAKSLGLDVDNWLEVSSSPLPVTLRLSPDRHDIEWTKQKLISLGGKPIEWLPNCDSWIMPFNKGDYPNEECKKWMILLHETGRITRQEAVSMLPPVVLEPKNDQLLMDTCAAPGSKATQLAEAVPGSIILANEPSSGRLNMLVTNRGRLGLNNMLIMQHDGRHIGRMPSPGLDGIIADVPCTGTGTTRKNKELWWKWTPKDGRSLFRLQTDIAFRSAQLLIPGGRMVYSTCSLDPVENEAVVVEILQRCPWLELIDIESERLFPGLKVHRGIKEWPILDNDAEVVEFTGELPKLPGLREEMLNPTQRNLASPNLEYTIRVNQNDNNTGGFFVALFRHIEEATPEGVAKSMIPKHIPDREPKQLPRPNQNRHTSIPASEEVISSICEQWGLNRENYAWWHRGKRVNLSSKSVLDRLYNPATMNNKGDFWPTETFHPLRIIHVGQPSFTDNKGQWRVKQESLEFLRSDLSNNIFDVPKETMIKMLEGEVPLVEDFPVKLPAGTAIIRFEEHLASVWTAARVSFMMDENEREILRLKLGVTYGGEEE